MIIIHKDTNFIIQSNLRIWKRHTTKTESKSAMVDLNLQNSPHALSKVSACFLILDLKEGFLQGLISYIITQLMVEQESGR